MAVDEKVKKPNEYSSAVDKCKKWFDYDKSSTSRQDYLTEMDENDKLWLSKHWDLNGPSGNPLRTKEVQAASPNAVENVAYALIDGEISEFAQLPDIIFFPDDAGDEEAATVTTDLLEHVRDKNHLIEEFEKWRKNFFLHGTGIWEHVWDPNWRGGRGPNRWVGDIRWRSVHPRAILPDARCGESIHNGRRIHKVCPVTLEHIEDHYKDHASEVQTETIDETFISSADEAQGEPDDDNGRVLLIETWYIGKPLVLDEGEKDEGPGLHVIWWAGEAQGVYLKHANYVYYEPGETVRFPFTFRQRHLRDGSVWGIGDAYFIKHPQIIHNKTVEMGIESHMWSSIGQGFYNEGALDKKQIEELKKYGTMPRRWFAVNDLNSIRRETGQSAPASLYNEANRLPKVMENIIGRPDVSQGKNPGSVTAAAAIDLLQRRAASRFISADEAIKSAFVESGEYIARLIWTNYTERRAYRLVSHLKAEDRLVLSKRGVFERDKYMNVWDKRTNQVAPLTNRTVKDEAGVETTIPAFQADESMVEGEDYEVYAPDLDIRGKTSQAMPSDRMVNIEWAMKLMQTNVIPLELLFIVIEKGRFPAWSEVQDKIAQWQQQMSQAQSPQGAPPQGGQPQGQPTQEGLDPELQAMVDGMSPEQAAQALQAMQNGEV